jgi:hypothetical protein
MTNVSTRKHSPKPVFPKDGDEFSSKDYQYNREPLKFQRRGGIYRPGKADGLDWGVPERRGRLRDGSKARFEIRE